MATLRLSRRGEEAAILAIWRRAVEATHDFITADDLAYFEGLIRDRYLPGRIFTLAVDAEDRPIAFMGMTGAHIDTLFVDPASLRLGIGSILIGHAKAQGALTVDVNEQNLAARAFYAEMGFVEAGRSDVDHSGRPYPLLHLACPAPETVPERRTASVT